MTEFDTLGVVFSKHLGIKLVFVGKVFDGVESFLVVCLVENERFVFFWVGEILLIEFWLYYRVAHRWLKIIMKGRVRISEEVFSGVDDAARVRI